MRVQNSQSEQYLLALVSNVFADIAHKFPRLKRSLSRDLETVRLRVSHEGVSFLTKTMPKLGKAIVRALETGKLTRPKEFKPYGSKEIPAFLSGILSCLFSDAGKLNMECDRLLLRETITLLVVAYKTDLPYSRVQEKAVIDRFVENESILNDLVLDVNDPLLRKAGKIIERIFGDFNPKDIGPRHGPGAVATGERGNSKWRFKRLYAAIHSFYPQYEYFMSAGTRSLLDNVGMYRSLERVSEGTSKVVLVPKDSRGPRLISCEPLEYQYVQQGLGRAIVRHLESHGITRGHVNFEKQSINAQLALESSVTRKHATLDMKDASDMVSLQLVESLFSRCETLLRALKATRTSTTRLPDGRLVPLKKFAAMGSALCFPVEATVFFVLCVAHLEIQGLRNAHEHVYVYGDDIIVPTEHAYSIMAMLEKYGLTVNRDKSFVEGYFRESCGTDAWRGTILTPIRNKVSRVSESQDANTAASLVSLANSFRRRGFEQTAVFLFSAFKERFGSLPYGTSNAPYLCEECPSTFRSIIKNLENNRRVRWDANSQRVQVFCRFLSERPEADALDSWPRLLKGLLSPSQSDPSLVVLPRRTQIKSGWRVIG